MDTSAYHWYFTKIKMYTCPVDIEPLALGHNQSLLAILHHIVSTVTNQIKTISGIYASKPHITENDNMWRFLGRSIDLSNTMLPCKTKSTSHVSRYWLLALQSSILHQFTPLTSGAAYIRIFIFYWHIKYHVLNMLKIKCDINQQNLKRVDLHFVKSE